ncbi:MAG: response regulator [Candidatus Omnitrophota bacterium]
MRKKILIVEDEKDILYLSEIRLKRSGYDVLEATNTKGLMELIRKEKPDLILLDLLLPGERGEEFCKKLKADPEFKKIPVILFTATAQQVQEKIEITGAEDGILKPFEPEILLKKIKALIK